MRIIHVEDKFFPNTGYQLPLLAKYLVKNGNEVIIITSEIDKNDMLTNFFIKEDINKLDLNYTIETGVKIIRMPVKGTILGRKIFPRKIYQLINSLNPDIAYIHGNDTLTGMRFIINSKKLNYPIILDSHMLEMASVNRFNKIFRFIYKKIITPIIIKNNLTVIRTQNDDYVQKCLGIPLKNAPWISTGTDILLFKKDDLKKVEFRQKYNINNKNFVIIYAGKLDEAKGGTFLAESILEKFETTEKEIVFVIVGTASGEYGSKVENLFKKSKNKIIRFQTQTYRDLPSFYQAADLAIFPKQCSLSFFDVQAVGLPVLFEDNTVNIDRIENENAFIFKKNDIKDFRKKILEIANMSEEKLEKTSINAIKYIREKYSYDLLVEEYIFYMNKSIDEWRKK